MADGDDSGMEEAERLIAECRRTRSPKLDLSKLGLSQLPRTLFALDWLADLDLSTNQLGPEGAKQLIQLPKLTRLRMFDTRLGPEGAKHIARIENLTDLKIGGNAIGAEGAKHVAELPNLTTLDIGFNLLGPDGAPHIARLKKLTKLECSLNHLGPEAAKHVAQLEQLVTLSIWQNDLGPDAAKRIARLQNLTDLDISSNGLGPDAAQHIARLQNLTTLNISFNDLGPDAAQNIAGLKKLTTLHISRNELGPEAAKHIARLQKLSSLSIDNNYLGPTGAEPLRQLSDLWLLDISNTGVQDLSPLIALPELHWISCSGCHIDHPLPALWMKPSLETVFFHPGSLRDVPNEVLSPDEYTDCLPALRAYLADEASGTAELTSVKVMILGNGRVGKTQLARRLQGKPNDYSEKSTHGVRVTRLPAPPSNAPAPRLQLWDFGGQDIYHGTHAMLLKSPRAIFTLAWEPKSESLREHVHDGEPYRNFPLPYWLAYVRAFGGAKAPVVVVQTQCDKPWDKREPNLPKGALDAFAFSQVLQFSAETDLGLDEMKKALTHSIDFMRESHDFAPVPRGRVAVIEELERLRETEAKRFLTQKEFADICEAVEAQGGGRITSPPDLLSMLHNMGLVFYRDGMFENRIVLDQQWALTPIYAVLEREGKTFRRIEKARGRFTREDLSDTVWKDYGPDEQRLFLSMMEQCGIAFATNRFDHNRSHEHDLDFIAPDLLPPRDDPVVDAQLRDKWGREPADIARRISFALLPSTLMRSLIAKIGHAAGHSAEYWRDGLYFFDRETNARALVEQARPDPDGWAGNVTVSARGSRAEDLAEKLVALIDAPQVSMGAEGVEVEVLDQPTRRRSDIPRERSRSRSRSRLASNVIEPAPEPRREPLYYVSYDHAEGKAAADALCAAATARGITIRRDIEQLKFFDEIRKFMSALAEGDRIFVILSDTYWKRPNCLFELSETFRKSQLDPEIMAARTRVFPLPSADLFGNHEQLLKRVVGHWDTEEARMAATMAGDFALIPASYWNDRPMVAKFRPQLPDLLGLYAGRLQPTRLEDYIEAALADLKPPR